MSHKGIVAIIPARFGSSRFLGKPLFLINGISLIQRTYEQACKTHCFDDVMVATDDLRILKHVEEFGGKACMTSPFCLTGTDRIIEAVRAYYPDSEIIMNIQGDTPIFSSSIISLLLRRIEDPTIEVSTPIMRITEKEEIENPNIVKCLFSEITQKALYFTRVTPFMEKGMKVYKHIGIYCFRKSFLLHYGKLDPSPLQQAEDLEQLKILEYGYSIGVVEVNEPVPSVDRLEDVKQVERILCQESTFLSQEG